MMEKCMKNNSLEWFKDAGFGMFIHWGLYSILGKGEHVMSHQRIPKDEYAKLADQFNPSPTAIKEWVRLAKSTGMKYMVLTTRHHDGFALFDSKVNEFNSVNSAAKRDFVAEYVEACREEGIKIGLYYSLRSWRFGFEREDKIFQKKEMAEEAHAQVRELMSNYGKIDILWYDGGYIYPTIAENTTERIVEFWESKKLNSMVRELQPEILINNRSGTEEDFSTPEQHINPDSEKAWECCMTIGSELGWGYMKYDPETKTTGQLIAALATATAGGGNLLLNIAPDGYGTVPETTKRQLNEIGDWMCVNSQAVYNTEPHDVHSTEYACGNAGFSAISAGKRYLHILRWLGSEIVLVNAQEKIKSAKILKTNQSVEIEVLENNRVILKGLPIEPPDRYDTVIALEF